MNALLEQVAARFGTPCYVYDVTAVRANVARVRDAFGGRFEISYAVKANPNVALLERLNGGVDALDISSGGELQRALRAGWQAGRISFTGPGKRDAELDAAVVHRIGHVIVESVAEARRLDAISRAHNTRQPVLARIAPAVLPPGFGSGMSGKPSQFGIDEEEAAPAVAEILALHGLDLQGFHIYAGTQCLKPTSLVRNFENCLRIFGSLAERLDLRPARLIVGGGLGIPYYQDDVPLDLAAVGAETVPLLDALHAQPRFAGTRLVMELGRYLVGPAGRFLTRILHIKTSRGVRLCVCDGGMHHHLAACGLLGSVIPRNYRMHKVGAESGNDAADLETFDLVGPLCTSIDRLGHRVRLPALQPGDVIAVESSGAYGLTSSPLHFISHPPPREVLVECRNGQWQMDDVTEWRDAIPPAVQ